MSDRGHAYWMCTVPVAEFLLCCSKVNSPWPPGVKLGHILLSSGVFLEGYCCLFSHNSCTGGRS